MTYRPTMPPGSRPFTASSPRLTPLYPQYGNGPNGYNTGNQQYHHAQNMYPSYANAPQPPPQQQQPPPVYPSHASQAPQYSSYENPVLPSSSLGTPAGPVRESDGPSKCLLRGSHVQGAGSLRNNLCSPCNRYTQHPSQLSPLSTQHCPSPLRSRCLMRNRLLVRSLQNRRASPLPGNSIPTPPRTVRECSTDALRLPKVAEGILDKSIRDD